MHDSLGLGSTLCFSDIVRDKIDFISICRQIMQVSYQELKTTKDSILNLSMT